MTWTYAGDPSASTLAALRFLIGDTITGDQQLSDEEITFVSTSYTDNNLAAAELCEAIAAKYARQVDTTNGDLRLGAEKRFQHYTDLAQKYRKKGNKLALMWSGGRLISEKQTAAQNTTLVQPSFSRGMDDFPGNGDSYDNSSSTSCI
jgi:hypothetical protein